MLKIQHSLLLFFMTLGLSPISMAAQNDTLRIFILAGQSNMQGWGYIFDETLPGSLEHTIANNSGGIYDSLIDDDGDFAIRDDVWVSLYNDEGDLIQEQLSVGHGGNEEYIGPEYGFGFTIGDHIEDDVLIIKTAWGGKSLAFDFRPPSSGGTPGPYYQMMVDQVNFTIENIPSSLPQLAAQPYKIEGFGWHQGWNDGDEALFWDQYEQNLINLVTDLRVELNTPDLPVVVANSGMGGFDLDFPDQWIQNIQDYVVTAQEAATEHPPFEGSVALADTRPFWVDIENSPDEAIHHWNENAWTYLNIGQELGIKMIELLGNNVTVHVNDSPSNSAFEVYPNPAEDFIHLQGIEMKGSLFIHNINGEISIHSNKIPNRIDVSKLGAGLYFISLVNNEGKTEYSSRFIKQ